MSKKKNLYYKSILVVIYDDWSVSILMFHAADVKLIICLVSKMLIFKVILIESSWRKMFRFVAFCTCPECCCCVPLCSEDVWWWIGIDTDFCSVPPWSSMTGQVVTFIKCLCLRGDNKAVVLKHCCVSNTGSVLTLKICLVRLSSQQASNNTYFSLPFFSSIARK